MRKLPVFEVLGHAVVKPLVNWRVSLLISFPLILVLALGLYSLGQVSTTRFGFGRGARAEILIPTIVFYVAMLFTLCNWAVNWHRFILLVEKPTLATAFISKGPTWRYLGNIILLGVALFLMEIPFRFVIAMLQRGSHELATILTLLFTFVTTWWSFRMSTKLPAVALGHTHYSVWEAWEATKGNFWRFVGLTTIFYIALIAIASLTLLNYGLGFNLGMRGLSRLSGSYLLVPAICAWLYLSFGISILTALYGYFGEGRNFVGLDLVKPAPKLDDWSWNKKLTPMSAPSEEAPSAIETIEKPVKPKPKKAVKKPAKKALKFSAKKPPKKSK